MYPSYSCSWRYALKRVPVHLGRCAPQSPLPLGDFGNSPCSPWRRAEQGEHWGGTASLGCPSLSPSCSLTPPKSRAGAEGRFLEAPASGRPQAPSAQRLTGPAHRLGHVAWTPVTPLQLGRTHCRVGGHAGSE